MAWVAHKLVFFLNTAPAKISCHVPEKTWQKQSRVTWLLLIG